MDANNNFEKLNKISGISNPYAPIPGCNYEDNKRNMLIDIESVKVGIEYINDTKAYYQLGIAIRNYTSWFVKGKERKKYLLEMVDCLDKAISLDKDNINARIELANILTQEKIIRNLKRSIELMDGLKKDNEFPSWLNSIYEKAKRWNGEIELPKNSDFTKIDPTPGVLREERTKLRELLVKNIKANNQEISKIIANRLYNLALLVACLYSDHDCNSGVIGFDYDKAKKTHKKIKKNFNYAYLGRIIGGNFLSDLDYKRIEKVSEPNVNGITIEEICEMVFRNIV